MNIKPHILTALIMTSAAAWAQQPPQDGPPVGRQMGGPMGGPAGMGHQRPGGDMMGENFFPPEMVMRNQKAINLTADQLKAIKVEMQKTMSRFTDLQWQQSAEEETMAGLMNPDHPEEKLVLAQLDRLLDIENEIKRLHLASMVRIKNILKPEQQSKLREMKKQDRPSMKPQGPSQQPPQQEGAQNSTEPPPPPPQDSR